MPWQMHWCRHVVRNPGDPRRLCGESDMSWVRILITRTRQDGPREDEYRQAVKGDIRQVHVSL